MTDQEWLSHFTEQKESGVSIRKYVKRMGVKESQWYKVRSRLLGKTNVVHSGFIKPQIVKDSPSKVKVTVAGLSLELTLESLELLLKRLA